MSLRKKILTATPLITLFLFLLIGFITDIWHPTWLIFLLNFIMPYILGFKRWRISVPLITLVAYLIICLTFDNLWAKGLIIFLLIPIIEIFIRPSA